MALFARLFGRTENTKAQARQSAERYTEETVEAVRKWLNRFFKGEDVREKFWSSVEIYRAKNRAEPRVNDIIWGILNERRSRHISDGLIGLFRNDTLAMQELLRLEGREADRLKRIIEVTTLDGCGAENVSTLDGVKAFRWGEAFIAPVCVPMLVECAMALGMTKEELGQRFVKVAEDTIRSFGKHGPAVTGTDVWNMIQEDVAAADWSAQRSKPRKLPSPPILVARKEQ